MRSFRTFPGDLLQGISLVFHENGKKQIEKDSQNGTDENDQGNQRSCGKQKFPDLPQLGLIGFSSQVLFLAKVYTANPAARKIEPHR